MKNYQRLRNDGASNSVYAADGWRCKPYEYLYLIRCDSPLLSIWCFTADCTPSPVCRPCHLCLPAGRERKALESPNYSQNWQPCIWVKRSKVKITRSAYRVYPANLLTRKPSLGVAPTHFNERELTLTWTHVHACYMLSSVRLSSVICNPRAPYSAVWNFL